MINCKQKCILVKLDDYPLPGRRMYIMTLLVDWTTRIVGCKVMWGIIGSKLAQSDPNGKLLHMLKGMISSNRHSIFNHDWTHADREFEPLTTLESIYHIENTQRVVKEILGVKVDTFGAPCNAYNTGMLQAIESVGTLKHWLYGEPSYCGRNFRKKINFETPLFRPKFSVLRRTIKNGRPNESFVLQAHPVCWRFSDAFQFFISMVYLKLKGYRFVFPSDLSDQDFASFK